MSDPPPPPRLILASRSPRRRELLAGAGYVFEVLPASETAECGICSGESPARMVARLAYQKAADVAASVDAGLVLGCDTVAEYQGQILGKPADMQHARAMLRTLRGKEHRVFTGVCLWEKLPDMWMAAANLFGSWADAVVAAGFGRHEALTCHQWTDKSILEVIRKRHRRKLPVSVASLRHQMGMVQSARNRFGSWENALRAAGVDPELAREQQRWTSEKVIAGIRRRVRQKEPLNPNALAKSEDRKLLAAGRRYFGNWNNALKAAGVRCH